MISWTMVDRIRIVERATQRYILWWSVAIAAVVLVVLAGIDLALPRDKDVSGALAVVPFLASTAGTPRAVGILGLAATAVALGLAFLDGSGIQESVIRIAVIAAGTLVAMQMASSRQRRERRLVAVSAVAEAAQRAIMSNPRPLVGSVAVAVRYQSSTRAATVGGDCFDVLDTPFGTRLFIGDVRGHGLPAVRLSALVLGAFRSLGQLEADLARVAREVDALLARYTTDSAEGELSEAEFVTAIFVEIAQDQMTIANCGHPPPLLLQPEGHMTMLDATQPALPLALGSQPKLDTVTVRPGTRVLLYTDGITESRDQNGVFFDLQKVLAGFASQPLEVMLDSLLHELQRHTDHEILDDVALLAFEIPAGAGVKAE